MEAGIVGGATWTNWVGNQTCHPAAVLRPRDEGEVVAAVRDAIAAGRNVRVAATGHSVTPVCLTDGVVLELADLAGVLDADPERRRATALAGTSVGAFGEPLWEAGLALANQGDIDTQQIGGAIGTGTHGSGIRLGSFSSTLRRARIVAGTGEVIEVSESTPELLHAAQVAVGMLGVMTEVEVAVAPAYRIRERILHLPYAEVAERWDELVHAHRHFSFFWIPVDGSGALYGLETPEGVPDGDTCYVKIYDEAAPDEPDDATPLARVDRPYRIYPAVFEPNFHELEYFVPIGRRPGGHRGDARADAGEPARRPLPDGGAHGRRRRRLPLLPARHGHHGDLRVRRPGHGLLGLPARRRSPARRVRGPGALGQASLPHPRAAACAVPGGGDVHPDPARARPGGNLPQRPPAPVVRVAGRVLGIWCDPTVWHQDHGAGPCAGIPRPAAGERIRITHPGHLLALSHQAVDGLGSRYWQRLSCSATCLPASARRLLTLPRGCLALGRLPPG